MNDISKLINSSLINSSLIDTSNDKYYLNPQNYTLKIDLSNTIFNIVANNDVRECEYFVKNKKHNINIQDNDGETALHLAIFMCNLKISKILLKNNIDLYIKDKYGQTAVHRIYFNISDENIIELVKIINKYDDKKNIFNISDNSGNTLLHSILNYISRNNIIMTKHYTELIETLVSFTNCNIINNNNQTIYDLMKKLKYLK